MRTKDLTALDTVYAYERRFNRPGKAVVLDVSTRWRLSTSGRFGRRFRRSGPDATVGRSASGRYVTGVLVLHVPNARFTQIEREPVPDEQLLAAARSFDLDALEAADDVDADDVDLALPAGMQLAIALPKDILSTWVAYEAEQAVVEAAEAERNRQYEMRLQQSKVEADRINHLATALNVRMEHAEAGDTRVGIRRPDMLTLLERLAKAEGTNTAYSG